MIPHSNDWRRWFNGLSKCEVTRERNFDSCKKRWFAGNLKSSSQASKCSNLFIARTLPLSCQCGQVRPYLAAFPLSSHLVVGIKCDIIEHFGSPSRGSLTRGSSFHLLTIFETPGTTLPLQPCCCCFLPVPLDILCYRTLEITFQMGSCLFFFSFRNVSWVGCRGFQREFTGASLWTMTPCSRMTLGTIQACRGPVRGG